MSTLKSLIDIESKPAILRVNFDELKKYLAKKLEKYDLVVTADTVKEAKALCTELNATKKVIDTTRKKEIAKASEPVKHFDAKMKELVSMCEDGRQNLLDQVKKFEDETRKLAKSLLHEYRDDKWEQLGVNEEFRTAMVDDLAIVTAVTGKGGLTAGARRSVDERVTADKSLQDRTENRLLVLENQSYKSGLSSPLTRSHVEAFLFQPDAQYQERLDLMIKSEVERQEATEAALRNKIQKEQERESVAAEPEQQPEPEPETAQQPEPAPENTQPVASKPAQDIPREAATGIPCTIVCTFQIDVDPRAPEEVIKAKFIERIESAGFQSLTSVEVSKAKKIAA